MLSKYEFKHLPTLCDRREFNSPGLVTDCGVSTLLSLRKDTVCSLFFSGVSTVSTTHCLVKNVYLFYYVVDIPKLRYVFNAIVMSEFNSHELWLIGSQSFTSLNPGSSITILAFIVMSSPKLFTLNFSGI